MGNKFSYTKQIEAPDSVRETLHLIRETRKKYLKNLTEEQTDSVEVLSEDINLIFNVDNKDDERDVITDRVVDTKSRVRSRSGRPRNEASENPLSPNKTSTIEVVDLEMYKYPFENLVFEGGGSKGLAYCGALRRLEELGIMKQIKRFAGTSAGSMTATLLAVGYNSHDLEEFFKLNLENLLLDHSWGYLSILPNILRFFGWNPGNSIYNWFGERIKEKTGNMDYTFKQVYESFGRELCIVVTNVNQMTPLYCHPKTTPDMPIRLAVRMSLGIPGLFSAVDYRLHGHTDYYVDGGVLCNYPIHCFDGWWLSMKKEHNFLQTLHCLDDLPRLLDKSERFGTYNDKTLGMQVYSDDEQDLLKYQLEHSRPGVELNSLPETKLAKNTSYMNRLVEHDRLISKKKRGKKDGEVKELVKALNSFLNALKVHNTDKSETIDSKELLAAVNDEKLFTRRQRKILFGDVEPETILNCLDTDRNGQIKFNELVSFMEESNIKFHYRSQGYERRTTGHVFQFLYALYDAILTNGKQVYVGEKDLKRTVGINTGYIGTTDFDLELKDVKFICERGRICLDAFLKYYVAANRCEKKPKCDSLNDSRQSLGSTDAVSMEVLSPPVPFIPLIDQTSASEDSEILKASMKSKITVNFQSSTENIPLLDAEILDPANLTDADISETVSLQGINSAHV